MARNGPIPVWTSARGKFNPSRPRSDWADDVLASPFFDACGFLPTADGLSTCKHVVMLKFLPSRYCTRHGAQPGCTWRDEGAPAEPLTRGPRPRAKSPMRVAGWFGQTKTQAPMAVVIGSGHSWHLSGPRRIHWIGRLIRRQHPEQMRE